ncbi:MAG: cell envelope integrity protein TolA [Gammaproteobacteria bacterium]|nr:cell envelope integrity protein TolA [Gammaproteobacteria bacterium]
MIGIIQKYPKAFAIALIAHIVLLTFFIFSFDWSKKVAPPPPIEVVQAVAVNEQQVQAELEKIRNDERKRKDAEENRVRDLEQKADNARREREKEQERLKEIERKNKEESERTRALEAERKKVEEKRKAEEKRVAEVQRKADEAQRKAEEQKRRAEEAEKKRKDEERRQLEAKQREEEERMRQQQLMEEESKLRAAADKAKATAMARQMQMMRSAIERHWNKVGLRKGVSCVVRIRLLPTGQVAGVVLKTSSGDSKFDNSVQDAILRAQPLPMPSDRSLINEFREIELEFINN